MNLNKELRILKSEPLLFITLPISFFVLLILKTFKLIILIRFDYYIVTVLATF